MAPALAIIATAAEILFGLLLVLGWKTHTTALLSGVLLTIFALTMTTALGVKAPLDSSVFSAAGGALLLANSANFPFSLDELVRRNKRCKLLRAHGQCFMRRGVRVPHVIPFSLDSLRRLVPQLCSLCLPIACHSAKKKVKRSAVLC